MLNQEQRAPGRSPDIRRPTVAVVGGGASGMLAAVQLLRAADRDDQPLRVVLIDRADRSGGVAYSTRDPNHLLNVTAARMSALPDEPDHFTHWRAARTGTFDPGEYAPRREFRHYLEEVLAASRNSSGRAVMLARLVADVAAAGPCSGHVRLRLADGGTLDADAAIIALGNLEAHPPTGCVSVAEHASYVNDPWASGALERLEHDERSTVVLIGTGLTMADIAATIAARCPGANMLAVSRSGLLARAHLPGRTTPRHGTVALDPTLSLPALVDTILARSAAGDPHWHELVDELRPLTQALWGRLTLAERADFLATRHRAWCVRRHRMPPQVAATLATLIGSGRLAIRTGTVELTSTIGGFLTSSVSGSPPARIAAAVNCTGPGLDPRASHNPLVAQLLADGHVRAHPLGIGFDTAANGAFISRRGNPSHQLFTLGPPRIGELYETTAIPEIRKQAQDLAGTLLTTLVKARYDQALVAERDVEHTIPALRP